MNLTFEDAEPIKAASTKTAEPNPFADVITAIAWRSDSQGRPLTRATTIPVKDEDGIKTLTAKIGRQLTAAGDALEKPGTVRRKFETIKNGKTLGLKVTFSVAPKQRRERKAKQDSTAAS